MLSNCMVIWQVQEVTVLTRTAMQNAVAVRVVDTAAQNLGDSELAVSFDFALHPWLPVIHLNRSSMLKP